TRDSSFRARSASFLLSSDSSDASIRTAAVVLLSVCSIAFPGLSLVTIAIHPVKNTVDNKIIFLNMSNPLLEENIHITPFLQDGE
ncbi:hypothetical protein EBS02_12665, partial [bacterium]|nr:hypothetical protein [bacterium]